MFKTKSRFALLSAIVIVMAMGVMLVGNTFANQVDYTSTETSLDSVDGYKDKNYSVALDYTRTRNGEYNNSMLNGGVAAFNQSTLWCPGRTEIVYLKLTNTERFATSCSLSLDVGASGFDNTLTYAVIDNLESNSTSHPTNWLNFETIAANAQRDTEEVKTGTLTGNTAYPLLYRELLATNETHYLALAIHMDEGADSTYQGKTMNLEFTLTVDADYKPGETPAPATDKP